MATIKATAHGIQWDVDAPGDAEHLPDQVNVMITIKGTASTISAEAIDDAISDAITKETGFCHKGFAVSHCDITEDLENQPMKKFVSPQGYEITGILEKIPGIASINVNSASLEDGSLQFDYAGDTELQWEKHEIVREQGQRVFVDDDENEFTEDELHFIDPENGIIEPTPVFPDRVKSDTDH